VFLLYLPALVWADGVTVTGKISRSDERSSRTQDAEVVVWLVPASSGRDLPSIRVPLTSAHPRLLQKDKTFQPHVLAVPAGTVVEFPNRDPFFHNVFSLFDGKRFDLGLYEAGSSRGVRFDQPGVSYIFCNIHPQMSAVVIAVNTPYYAMAGRNGNVTIPNVPPGQYRLHVWIEGVTAEALKAISKDVIIPETGSSFSLGALRLPGSKLAASHKNKYGRDYDPPPPTAAYDRR
jgi:plastocyanin